MNIFRNNFVLSIYSNLDLTQAKIMARPLSKAIRDKCSNHRHWVSRDSITIEPSLIHFKPNLSKFNCLLNCFLTLMNMVQFQLKYIKEYWKMTAFRELTLYKRLNLKDVTKNKIIKPMPFNQKVINITVYRYLQKDNGTGVSWALHVVWGELTSKERKNKHKPKRKNKWCQSLPGSL